VSCFFVVVIMYNNGMAQEKNIVLPKPKTGGPVSLEEAIQKRRSIREYGPQPLAIDKIGQLLWAAQGITSEEGAYPLRAAPSAGALYPIEVYVVNPQGVFLYNPEAHSLTLHKQGDHRLKLMQACLHQSFVAEAPVSILMCAVYERIMRKYGARGRMYTHIEAGHIAQNIHLQAVTLGLGSVPIGAFNAQEIKGDLGLPQDYEPIYVIPVGYPQ